MSERLDLLFEAVRAACSTAAWSRGVELTRAGAVVVERTDDDEALFRIAQRGGMISRTVTLFPDDPDWDCGCDNPDRACEHVAAAVIAWRRALAGDAELPTAGRESGRVGYRFTSAGDELALERVIVHGDESHALRSTLAAVAEGRVEGPSFIAAQADLATELALGTHRHGLLAMRLIPGVFDRLAHCADVTLDGEPVRVSGTPVLPRAVVVDQGDGFRVFLEQDRTVERTFANGVALAGGALRPVGDPRLTGRELHTLPRGRTFEPREVGELVTEMLPSLGKRIPLDIRTNRLPDTSVETPRIQVEVRRDGEALSVLATLVYGDPPRARIDGGRLVHLQGPIPLRNEPVEKRELRRLQRELQLAAGVRELLEGEAAVAFTRRLERWEGGVTGRAHEAFRLVAPLTPRLSLDGERLDVVFESPAHGRADPGAVLRAWHDGASLVPLLEGGWSPLPADWLERYGQRIADLLAAREPDGALPLCSVPDLARLCEELDQPPPPAFDGLRGLLEGFEGIPETPLPDDLQAELRDYQRRGVDWLVFLRRAGLGGLLADDMGLGKTLQALCALHGRTLVVAPTSVLHNWADEIRKFRSGLSFNVFHGLRRELDPEVDVTLTTYAVLRLDADKLTGVEWDTVVLDEAQAIKNPDSQVAGAAYRLKSKFKMTLTGTPVENRLDELWSQFQFINRGLLGGRSDFRERYADPIAAGAPDAAARLRERVRPFILRRLKSEVAPELPPRTEVVLRCELEPAERDVYEMLRLATMDDVVARVMGGNVLAALEALLRLRQAACHTALVPGQQAARSSKLDLLNETLDSILAEGHKALVFSQWTSLLDLTEPGLRAAGIDFLRLDGSTRDRQAVVRGFQATDGPPVLLISLKAGGTGLNLTAADHIFLLDPWWNPAVEDQAADRAHRIGQDRPVMVYRLVAADTVEERILALQTRKREIADAALGEADRAAGITREELLDLLR